MPALLSISTIHIRPFTPDDYPIMAAIGNACFPEYADTPDALRHYDTARADYIKWNHFLAEVEGEPVALAGYNQRESMYHPRKFNVDVIVRPECQRRGIGTALFRHLLAELEPFEPILLRGHAQEGRMGGPVFLAKQGFVEAMRDWESRLQPVDFDPSAHGETVERVLSQAIIIKSLAELATDPDRNIKLYEMHWQVTRDMPSTDEPTKTTFETFCKRTLESPDFLPEGWFVALDGDQYIGESTLWKSQTSKDLYVGSTGVLGDYRRRGIASALKVYATTFAKEQGAGELKTWNAQSNRGMLAINEAMGFLKQPAWISFEKRVGDE